MKSEQASGKPVDKRADIWAFGVVLWEMLTGKRMFSGETVSHTIAAVLIKDPDWQQLPAETPPSLTRLLKRCLERDLKRRLADIGTARLEIEDAAAGGEVAVPPSAAVIPESRKGWSWIVAAVAIVVAAAAGWGWWRATRPVEKPLVRLEVDLGSDVALPSPEVDALSDVVLSPDGTRLAYLAGSSGGQRLFTRRLDQPRATELSGTDGAIGPAFSPDGQWIGFFAGGKFNRISVEGGAVVPLVDVPGFPGGASWGNDGNIVGSGTVNAGVGAGGLGRIPSGGGTPAKVTDANGDLGHVLPQILPGGKAVLFVAYPTLSADKAHIDVVTLADGRRKTVVSAGASARYVPTSGRSGHLLYNNKGTVFAIPFDLDRLETRGTAIPVLDDVAYQSASGSAQMDVSQSGTLVYRKVGGGTSQSMATIQWLTRGSDGTGRTEPLRSKPGLYPSPNDPRFSPDGTRLAMVLTEQGKMDVWVYDLRRDAMTRLTAGEGPYTQPVWNPDSRYLFFGSFTRGILWTRADGAGEPRPLTQTKNFQVPWSLTPDGKRLAYFETAGAAQIWTVPLEETAGQMKAGKPEQFPKSQFFDYNPAFSPDGKWLAYVSNATGSNEVFVRAFPDTGGRWQISNNGATRAVWSPNGRDLLYHSGDQIMAVGYTAKGDAFVAEKPRIWLAKLGGTLWDLAPDGKRLAVVTPVDAPQAPKQDHEIVMLLNFFDELRRRVPASK